MTSDTYAYHPLPSGRYVRLLELLPVSASPADMISVKLRPCSLDSNPDYESISYVWGNANSRKPILCDGGCLNITTNLHDALTHFRLPDKSRLLWADAVCINQNDLSEREKQVQLMHMIYKLSRRCLVWLGPSDESSDIAVRVIKHIALLASQRLGVPVSELASHLYENGRDMLLSSRIGFDDLPSTTSTDWASFLAFFTRPWFSRIWVVQEVFFAPSSQIHCGAAVIPFVELWYASDWALTNIQLIDRGLMHRIWPATGPRYRNVLWMHGGDPKSQQKKPLAWVLREGLQFDATDPRDLVYALINFENFQRDAPHIVPDYTASMAHVYRDIAVAIMERTKSLLILTSLDFDTQAGEEDVPSWVPKLHHRPTSLTILPVIYNLSRAGVHDNVPVPRLVGPDVLRLSGFQVDTVADVCTIPRPDPTVQDAVTSFDTEVPWAPYEILEGAPYPSKEAIINAYAMALTSGVREYEGINTIRCTQDMAHVHQVEFIAWLQAMRALGGPGVPPGLYSATQPSLVDGVTPEQAVEWAQHFRSMIKVATFDQRLFRTKKGYLGIGSKNMVPGDRLCVLLGGALPLLLRSRDRGEGFQYVGGAYVHGIMEGEVVESWKKGEIKVEEFDLH